MISDSLQTALLVVDGSRIRKVSTADGSVTTLCGTTARATPISGVQSCSGPVFSGAIGGIAMWGDFLRGLVYVTDTTFHQVRMINLTSSTVQTICGSDSTTITYGQQDGDSVAVARLTGPTGLAVSSINDKLYVMDAGEQNKHNYAPG
jgi:DNA-binding beta-propeller fold protein YncE